ncbi:hypothetical protein N7468_003458 [Penicillium chermesinum]|uniref:Uncharacterized protein n=1 Tax=Penicillium chermesinum TaxID=63820 RepID=A0A9W9TTE1_9EURO|nr:uncharacterized protein N7468_003458 [Penicillium chermesinum]KAJ5238839.1 hypothetical protein N7468_003458 [Penicillium chermesinum]KAJ6164476.1 hypothetical protein N7470_003148 [Penicillium chermesinum]
MSDDEEYYEWEEDYLFEDPVPDLVDELAASSYYEAALYDDPAYDFEEYFSDWEYYSDDYYDDDPTVKKSTLRAKSEPTQFSRGHPGPRVSRKLPKQTSRLNIDTASFQGVVWRTKNLEKDQDVEVQIYQPGNGDKVALLKNWREIFKSAQPSLNKSRLRKRKARGSLGTNSSDADASDADDGNLQGEGYQMESSDEMSDVLSTDHVDSMDAGGASNTTPEQIQSTDELDGAKEVSSAKRGRKRKAEVVSPDPKKSNPAGNSTRSRSKRVALESDIKDSGRPVASSGAVRRSARSKK